MAAQGSGARPRARPPSGLVAFLLTDIEGSTRLWQHHPARMRQVIARHDGLLREGIAAHGGRVLTDHGEGDSFFAVFGKASEALAAARDIQLALHRELWPADMPIRVRMAINAGEAGGDYRGMAANRSARIRQLAQGGEVMVSQSVQALVRDELPEGVRLTDLGLHDLRDVSEPERVYQARILDLPEPAVPTRAPRPALRGRLLPFAGAVIVIAAAAVTVGVAVTRGRQPAPSSAGRPHLGAAAVRSYRISTVAGDGTAGYLAPLDGRATEAELDRPSGLALDAQGDLFIADTGNNRIREVKPDGTISNVVGGGDQFAATGQLGVEIRLDHPTGLFMGADGNLYIADTGGNRVLYMNPQGSVFPVAGTGRPAPGPQVGPATTTALNAPTSAIYGLLNGSSADGRPQVGALIADTGDGSLRWILDGVLDAPVFYGSAKRMAPPTLGSKGSVSLFYTSSQILYYADSTSNQVWMSTNEGGFDKPVLLAGTGTPGDGGDGGFPDAAQLDAPGGVTADSSGNVYISDTGNNVVRLVDARTGRIYRIAGNTSAAWSGDGGPALYGSLEAPTAIVVAPNGDVYVADTGDNRIRLLVPSR